MLTVSSSITTPSFPSIATCLATPSSSTGAGLGKMSSMGEGNPVDIVAAESMCPSMTLLVLQICIPAVVAMMSRSSPYANRMKTGRADSAMVPRGSETGRESLGADSSEW
jgi:hypothetical protein